MAMRTRKPGVRMRRPLTRDRSGVCLAALAGPSDMTSDSTNPQWVSAILNWRWTGSFARLALVSPYVVGGLAKATDFAGAIAEQEHFGLHPGWLWAAITILVELGGPVLILSGRLVWLGAGALGV